MLNTIHNTDCLTGLRELPSQSVNCCVTSPPYYGLRDYGHDGQIGLEETPEAYVQKLVEVFREVKRVMRDDGTLWLNLGDSYASDYKGSGGKSEKQKTNLGSFYSASRFNHGCKPKDLIGIPWLVAFALRADGWYLRQDIIWCLSGGTWLYVRTQKGDMPMMVSDVARLDSSTVKLWNGKKWTNLLGMNRNHRNGDELEIVIRSGERISCTPTHRFPTTGGLKSASDLKPGDRLLSCTIPEPDNPRDCSVDEDAAWFAGLYIAEGSRSEDTIQISGHSKESDRWNRVQRIAQKFGGSATVSINGNNQSIRVYGKVLNAILDELVSGKTSHNKGFSSVVWKYSNRFIASMVDGYLSGDGHTDINRYRLGFCRNYNLERDLRTACARLGYTITLTPSFTEYNGKKVPSFRGEIRKKRSGHFNEKDRNEIICIRKARCREVYDLGVEDNPHIFSLASGVLTHNSKPNPMPESVTDRCTKSHEYIFLLSKSARYYYDAEAIKQPIADSSVSRLNHDIENQKGSDRVPGKTNGAMKAVGNGWNGSSFDLGKTGEMKHTRGKGYTHRGEGDKKLSGHSGNYDANGNLIGNGLANKRSVWTVTTKPFKESHFATFPPDLIVDCIKAGCPEDGVVLDPFMGAGTTAMVARKLNRNYVGYELNPEYIAISERRLAAELGLFA